jgi:hypothetical protein
MSISSGAATTQAGQRGTAAGAAAGAAANADAEIKAVMQTAIAARWRRRHL